MKQTKNLKINPKKTDTVRKKTIKNGDQKSTKKNSKTKTTKALKNVLFKASERQRHDSSSETTICGSPKLTKKTKASARPTSVTKANKSPNKRSTKNKNKETESSPASKTKSTKPTPNNKTPVQSPCSKNTKRQALSKSSAQESEAKNSKNNGLTNSSKSKTLSKNSKTPKRKSTSEPQQLRAMFEKEDMKPRGPRLASLNASCKMQLLYECEKYQPFVSDNSSNSDTEEEQTESRSESDASEVASKSNDSKTKSFKSNSNHLASTSKGGGKESEDNDLLTDDESDYQSVSSISKKTHDDSQETIEEDTEKSSSEDEYESEPKPKSKLTKKRSTSLSFTVSKTSSQKSKTARSKNAIKKGKSEISKQANKLIKEQKPAKKLTLKERKREKTKAAKQNDVKKITPKNSKRNESDKSKKGRKPKAKGSTAKTIKKRKLVDDTVELIDTRSSKRMASLNASAMMAASLQNEKSLAVVVRPPPTLSKAESRPEDLHADSVEVIQKTKTTTVINNEVTETIETIKQVRQVSSKIRDRVLSIEMLDSSHPNNETDNMEHINTGIVEEPASDDEVMSRTPHSHSTSKRKFTKKMNGGSATVNGNAPKTKAFANKSEEKGSLRTDESGSSQVTSMTSTTTTKVKINKRRSLDKSKTTVEKYQYEVHGAFNPFNASIASQSANNLRSAANQSTASGHLEAPPSTINSSVAHQGVISLGQQPLAAAGYGFTPGYCIYPSYPTQLELAYQAHAAVSQLNSSQQQPSTPSGSNQQIHYAQQIPGAYSAVQQPLFPNPQFAMLNLQEPGRTQLSGQYKSAFSVPQNATPTSTTTPTSPATSAPYTSRLNGTF